MTIYKDNLDTKLGVTFYRRDPQEGSSESSAIVSRLTDPTSPAFGQLAVGSSSVMTLRVKNMSKVETPLVFRGLLQ